MLRGLSVQQILAKEPWTNEQLNEAYFTDCVETRKALEELEGYKIWSELESLCLSYNIFIDAVRDLYSSINHFRYDSNDEEFWNQRNINISENLIIKVQRGVFSTIISALSLVLYRGSFNKKYPVENYQEKVNSEFANNELHLFLKGLRNYISHWKISKGNWRITNNKGKKEVVFLLFKEELLKWSEWSTRMKHYIETNVDINVEELLKQYQRKVEEFHRWHYSAVIQKYGKKISEYLTYERYLNQVQTQCEWNLFLTQIFIPKNINLYQYLDQFLSKPQLKDILSFPYRSKEQVDRIIDFVDLYQSCTEEIREKLYELFKVK